MALQSSKKIEVNGNTTLAVCSPHPNPLPGGARGLFRAGIILWGTLSPVGEGEGLRPGQCKRSATGQFTALLERAIPTLLNVRQAIALAAGAANQKSITEHDGTE